MAADPGNASNAAKSPSDPAARLQHAADTANKAAGYIGGEGDGRIGDGSAMGGDTDDASKDLKDAAQGAASVARAGAKAAAGNWVGAALDIVTDLKSVWKLICAIVAIILIPILVICLLPFMLFSAFTSTLDSVLDGTTAESSYYTDADAYGEAFYDMVEDLANYIDGLYVDSGVYDEAYSLASEEKKDYENEYDADEVNITLTVLPDEESGLLDQDSFVEILAKFHTIVSLSEEGDTYYGIMWDGDDVADSIEALETTIDNTLTFFENVQIAIQNVADAVAEVTASIDETLEGWKQTAESWDSILGNLVSDVLTVGQVVNSVLGTTAQVVISVAEVTVGAVGYTVTFVVTLAGYAGLQLYSDYMDYVYKHALISSIATCARNGGLFEIGDPVSSVALGTYTKITGYDLTETTRTSSETIVTGYVYSNTMVWNYILQYTDTEVQTWNGVSITTWEGAVLSDSDGDGVPDGYTAIYDTVEVEEEATSETEYTNANGDTFTVQCFPGEEDSVADSDGDGIPDGYTTVTEEVSALTGSIRVTVTMSADNFMAAAEQELMDNHGYTEEYIDELVEDEKAYILAEYGEYIELFTFSKTSVSLSGDGIITSIQEAIVEAALEEPTTAADKCALWVTNVYASAGYYISGNANDMGRNNSQYSLSAGDDIDTTLLPGMILATEHSASGTSNGILYGHVGVYIGDGYIMHSAGGAVYTDTVEDWIAKYYSADSAYSWDGVIRSGDLYWGYPEYVAELIAEELASMVVSSGELPEELSTGVFTYTALGECPDHEGYSAWYIGDKTSSDSGGNGITHVSTTSRQGIFLNKYWVTQDEEDRYNSQYIATIGDYLLIACTETYGTVGDIIVFTLSNGTDTKYMYTIMADTKSSADENYGEWGHIYDSGCNVIEFEMMPKALGGIGTASSTEYEGYEVVSWVNYGAYAGN